MPIVSKPPELVVHVRCLRCRHKSLLSKRELADFGIPPISGRQQGSITS
jgi:hypothetical protein